MDNAAMISITRSIYTQYHDRSTKALFHFHMTLTGSARIRIMQY